MTNGQYIQVYAGVENANPRQGILFVNTENPATGAGSTRSFALPAANGIAHLVSRTGNVVEVQDAAGNTFQFDTGTMTWAH